MEIKILSLSVTECGPLKDIRIDFSDSEKGVPQSVTVLGGANGTGKTTALELIFSLFDLFKLPPNTKFDPLDPMVEVISDILKRTEYAELNLLIDNEPCTLFWGEDKTENDDPVKIRNKHGIQCILEEGFNEKWEILSTGAFPEKINTFIKKLEKRPLGFPFFPYNSPQKYQIPTMLYIPSIRELPLVEGDQIHREEGEYRFTYRYQINRAFEKSFDSYLIWLDYADHEQFRLVIDFLNDLNFGGKTFSIKRKDLSVVVTTKEKDQHRLNALSSGEQNILITLLEIRRRIIPGSIVLIDEIENSLHPEFQYLIANSLLRLQREIPFQLLLTTHQREFLKIFGWENARILTEF